MAAKIDFFREIYKPLLCPSMNLILGLSGVKCNIIPSLPSMHIRAEKPLRIHIFIHALLVHFICASFCLFVC